MTACSQKAPGPIRNFDPLGRFLRARLHLSPVAFGLLILLANILVDGFLGWRYDVFLTTSGTPGLLQDYMALVTDLVFNPVMSGLYLWVPLGTARLFERLQGSRIFKSDSSVARVVDQYRPLYMNRWFFYIALVLSLGFSLSQVAGYYGRLPWKPVGGYLDLHPAMSLARAPFWLLNVYVVAYAAFNVGVTIFVLRKLFGTHEIRLQPLHPDGCGGLGSLSEFSTRIAVGIAAIGLMISAATVLEIQQGTIWNAFPVLAGVVAYAAFAPLFFFWPLGTAHDAMQEAKDAEMLMLAREFDRLYDEIKSEIVDRSQDSIKSATGCRAILSFIVPAKEESLREVVSSQALEKLENLRQLYHIAGEFPVWPFDTRNLRRFFTVVTTPLVPAIISVIVEVVKVIIGR